MLPETTCITVFNWEDGDSTRPKEILDMCVGGSCTRPNPSRRKGQWHCCTM